jgi:hypothetical protein
VASVACAAPVARTKDTAVNIHFIQTRLLIVLLLIAFSGAECNTLLPADERAFGSAHLSSSCNKAQKCRQNGMPL